jgi:AMMECR1 domain-containing protein
LALAGAQARSLARHSAKAGFSTAELVIQLFLVFDLHSKASTPPSEERVTSFFTRVKKEVTKKESTLRGALGYTHGVRKDCAGSNYVFVEVA